MSRGMTKDRSHEFRRPRGVGRSQAHRSNTGVYRRWLDDDCVARAPGAQGQRGRRFTTGTFYRELYDRIRGVDHRTGFVARERTSGGPIKKYAGGITVEQPSRHLIATVRVGADEDDEWHTCLAVSVPGYFRHGCLLARQ